MSKFADFLSSQKIDPRRVLSASRLEERLRPEDRAARWQKRHGKSEKPAEGEAPAKRRSGRPVTPRLVQAASEGKPVSGPAKTRLLRAVNRILQQKKKDPVDLKQLF